MYRNQATMRWSAQIGDDQKGSALVISLIMLLVVSLLAIGGLRSTILQERMSANLHDRELAFQAAEAALRAGERFLANNPPGVMPNGNSGMYTQGHPNTPNWLAPDAVVTAANAISYDTSNQAMQGVAAQPQYFIEELEVVPPGTETELGPVSSVGYYRITARGFGGTLASVVVVSSVFRNQ